LFFVLSALKVELIKLNFLFFLKTLYKLYYIVIFVAKSSGFFTVTRFTFSVTVDTFYQSLKNLLDLSVENKKKIQKWASPEKANPLIEKKSIYRMLKQNIYYCKIQTMRL